jgi:hypothetical protein
MKDVQYGTVSKEVSACRVYKKPSILSELVTYLYPGEIVVIDEAGSTSCYYKVKFSRSTGIISGYCLYPHIELIEKEKENEHS